MRRLSCEPTRAFEMGDVTIMADEGLVVVMLRGREERLVLCRPEAGLFSLVLRALATTGETAKAAEAIAAACKTVRTEEIQARPQDSTTDESYTRSEIPNRIESRRRLTLVPSRVSP